MRQITFKTFVSEMCYLVLLSLASDARIHKRAKCADTEEVIAKTLAAAPDREADRPTRHFTSTCSY